MNNFKRACSIAGVTGSAKASLEECIDGLKQLKEQMMMKMDLRFVT